MSKRDLQDQIVFITGAARGIGRECTGCHRKGPSGDGVIVCAY